VKCRQPDDWCTRQTILNSTCWQTGSQCNWLVSLGRQSAEWGHLASIMDS